MHTHMNHAREPENQGWRRHWFVKNILAELPLIGGFFLTDNLPRALHYTGKSVAMLAGGAAGMMLETIKTTTTDSMGVRMTKATTNMAIGMSLGNMTYNTLHSLSMTAYYRYYQTNEQNRRLVTNQDSSDSPASVISEHEVSQIKSDQDSSPLEISSIGPPTETSQMTPKQPVRSYT